MKKVVTLLSWLLATIAAHAQGQLLFANYVEGIVDAPVLFGHTGHGPGPEYTAELWIRNPTGQSIPLSPISTFPAWAQSSADRYWEPKIISVPGVRPGESTLLVARVWKTSFGSFDRAVAASSEFPGLGLFAESDTISVTLGGGALQPAPLVGLQGFMVAYIPEASVVSLSVLAAILFLLSKKAGIK
jgi:hypothetical protein